MDGRNAPLGIRSAKGAGLRVVAVTTTNPAEVLRAEGADFILERTADVATLLDRPEGSP